jgi:hypothetical protein
MRRIAFFTALLIFSLVGISLAQNAPTQELFTEIRQIGRLRPQGIQYDPNFDRFVQVDLSGRLVLVDAATFETQHVLYEQGAYNAYKFSHDGRYLALAIDRRVEIWDTNAGTLSADFAPDGANLVTGPLHFSPDDSLLLLDTVVPAPAATRRSENDTSIIPWVWDLPAAREEAPTTLPNQANAYAFFNFRNGLVLGPNRALIAGINARLQVIDGRNVDLPVISEIESSRLEIDPIYVWRSLRDDFMYVDPSIGGRLVQVNTEDGSLFNIPVGSYLGYGSIRDMNGLQFSNLARIIGEPNTERENSFLRLLFGENYRAQHNYQPLTVILLDILQPLTVTPDQMGLLVYTFNEASASGVIEFVRPQDVQQMVLHPDNKHLMVRRASGLQPIEVYDLDTGGLVQTHFPSEPDSGGSHILAYNATGTEIITDFQRFDAETGEVILEDVNYTSGFQQFYFTQDNRRIVTLNGDDWRVWDTETGEIVQRERVIIQGPVLQQSPDADRFLTRYNTQDGEVMEIVKVGQNERQSITIPNLPGRSIESIIPSADWQNYFVVYSANPFSQHYPGNEIAVYNINQGRLLFIAGDDLPQPDGRQYGWLDHETIYVSTSNTNNQTQPARIYGINWHPSGLPACLVNTYPENWRQWVGLWEQLNLRLRADQLGRLTQRLCEALPPNADDLVPALTPTARFNYRADATPLPIAIVGVPTCLTGAFSRESLDYAALWREITVDLSDEQREEMATLLCEGLITSVSQIRPTPTVDINQLVPPTPTPVESAPETTDSGFQQTLSVMTINIATRERFTGTYIPPVSITSRNLQLVINLFRDEEGYFPNNVALSPDGTLFAVSDAWNFIRIFRLTRPYNDLVADETTAIATRQSNEANSIGLLPTATEAFDYVGQPRPTLTLTVTPTPPPIAEATVDQADYGQVEEYCPSETLYDIAAPPPEYTASGRLFVPPVGNSDDVWVLEPENGHLYLDESIPLCVLGGCDFSPDRDWMLQQSRDLLISRPDGTSPSALFTAAEAPVWPNSISWIGSHILEYRYQGYLPEKYSGTVTLIRRFDPESGLLTDPFEPPPGIIINELSTNVLAVQPAVGILALVSTPYNSGSGSGSKYYIFDRETGEAAYFARVDSGGLENYQWDPLGRALYYRIPGEPDWFIFDARTRQHSVLGELPSGLWSRDFRYVVEWFSLPGEEIRERLEARQRVPKIAIWDSQTGLTRRYCIPETGLISYAGTPFTWSPDNRYLAFRIQLPFEGDVFPTPVTPNAPTVVPTPIPLETQYQLRNPRTVVLDTQTGSLTVLSEEVGSIAVWMEDAE